MRFAGRPIEKGTLSSFGLRPLLSAIPVPSRRRASAKRGQSRFSFCPRLQKLDNGLSRLFHHLFQRFTLRLAAFNLRRESVVPMTVSFDNDTHSVRHRTRPSF